jgi:threonine aldolase
MAGRVHFVGDGDPDVTTPAAFAARLGELAAEGKVTVDRTSRGGSVAELERAACTLFGKQAALWTPTGTMANLLGVAALARKHGSPRVLLPAESHIYNDTGDGLSRLMSLQPIPLAAGAACFSAREAGDAIAAGQTGGRVSSCVGVCVVESPVRRRHGELVPLQQMREITSVCRSRGVHTHLDGARLHMMAGALGVDAREIVSLFDTVYIDTHKYFGAPSGALLLGSADVISGLCHERRMVSAPQGSS